ncbi:hypothetical protein XENTR_v10010928 [Xenopus tropicalis]|nr:hypothetical protein XENTR_v10010928 [Xenopus tropicalis]
MTSGPQRVLDKCLSPCLFFNSKFHPTSLKAPVPVTLHNGGPLHLGDIVGTARGLTRVLFLCGVILWPCCLPEGVSGTTALVTRCAFGVPLTPFPELTALIDIGES